jgi:hypothetical protein
MWIKPSNWSSSTRDQVEKILENAKCGSAVGSQQVLFVVYKNRASKNLTANLHHPQQGSPTLLQFRLFPPKAERTLQAISFSMPP